MKKLTTLVFALLFTAGMAYGQNNANTEQYGSGNDIAIEQVFTGSGGVNEADVLQDGNDNTVELLRTIGTDNEYYIDQIGNHNVIQGHAEQGESSNPSFFGDIDVLQEGNNNAIWDIDQYGWDNDLDVDQLGDNNTVNVDAQVSTASTFVGVPSVNDITITQTGNNNAVGSNLPDGAGVYQEGQHNIMTIEQNGGASAGTSDYMPGSSGPFGYTSDYFHPAEGGQGLIQLGEHNALSIVQNVAASVDFTYQNGTYNSIDITQNTVGDVATSIQVGSSNTATIVH